MSANNSFAKKIKSVYSNTLFMLRFITHCKRANGRLFLILKIFNAVLNVLVPLLTIKISGAFLNELVEQKDINRIILLALLIVLIPLCSFLIQKFVRSKIASIQKIIEIEFSIDYFRQFMAMEYELLEQPDVQVKKIRAGIALFTGISIIDRIIGLFSSIITVVSIAFMLEINVLNLAIVLMIAAFEIIGYFLKKNAQKSVISLDRERSKNDMVLGVYQNVIDSFDAAKEIRLFQADKFLISFFEKKNMDIAELERKKRKISDSPEIYCRLLETVKQVAVYASGIYSFIKGALNIGSFTVFLSFTNQISSAVSSFVNEWLALEKSSLQIQEYIDFIKYVSEGQLWGKMHPEADKQFLIEFENVSFQYPGSSNWALKNINIKIKNNDRLCIVGENGAGKSTFIKLLCGLYKPTEGRILLNGNDIRLYDIIEYRRLISVVFQDFSLYPLSIKDNVVLGTEFNEKEFNQILDECSLSGMVNHTAHGENTYIGKEIYSDGITPSGGESQKIAIARALYHTINSNSNLYILDEPTAALDPNAEYEIYTQFHNMIKGKTAILVTHRLSAVQLADKIAVFDNGQIVEYGTHSELYANGGKYKEMFDKQAEFYVNAKK